jgi:TonB family protein
MGNILEKVLPFISEAKFLYTDLILKKLNRLGFVLIGLMLSVFSYSSAFAETSFVQKHAFCSDKSYSPYDNSRYAQYEFEKRYEECMKNADRLIRDYEIQKIQNEKNQQLQLLKYKKESEQRAIEANRRMEELKKTQEKNLEELNVNAYGKLVSREISKHKQYPKSALEDAVQGDVVVDIEIDGNGNVLSKEIRTSSGSESLDKQALEMVKKASPFAMPPKTLRDKPFHVSVPITFKLE